MTFRPSPLASAWIQVLGIAAFLAMAARYPVPGFVWPLPAVAALAASLAIAQVGPLRGSADWYRLGRIGPVEIALGVATAAISAGALVAWVALAEPDLSDLTAVIPRLPPLAMIVLGVGFATINAAAEEAIYRGALQGALYKLLGRGSIAREVLPVVVQAVLFGLAHANGFPRGTTGMILAGIYGLALGLVRAVSGGLFVAWATHTVADFVIYVLLIGALES